MCGGVITASLLRCHRQLFVSMLEPDQERKWQVQYLLMKPEPELYLFAATCVILACVCGV